MPIYEYLCRKCGNRFEHFKLSKDDTVQCPQCNSEKISKLISKTSFELKGEGWAKDSYAKKGK